MVRLVKDLLLLVGEACFGFSLQIIRHVTKNEFGYESTTRYGTEATAFSPLYIMTAVLAIIMGYLADNFVGKYYISIIGVLMVFCACLCTSFNIILPIPPIFEKDFYLTCATTFLMIYISTSGVRNAMLLEQFDASNRKKNFRKYIFGYVIIRLFTYSLTPVLSQLFIPQEIYRDICILSVFTCFAYILLLILILPKFYIEAVYFRIWEKCVDCFVTAMRRRNWQRRATKAIVINPIRLNKAQVKTKANLSHKSGSPVHKDAVKNKVKFSNLVQLKFQGGAVGETIPEPKVAKTKWGFRLTKSISPSTPRNSRTRDSAESDEEKVHDLHYIVIRRHWLDFARPKRSEYVISQSRKLLSVIHMLIPPFFFTLLSFMILWQLSIQGIYSIKSKSEPTSEHHYCTLIDMVSFPIFEYVIHSIFSRFGFREFHFIFTGYLFLILAAVCTLIIQIELETTLQYLPLSYSSQIRIFNNVHSNSTVYTSWSTPEIVPPFNYILLKGIQEKKMKHRVKVINVNINLAKTIEIDIVNKRTVSYIISESKGFARNNQMDPTIFTNDKRVDKTKSLLFLVTPFPPDMAYLKFNSGTVENYIYLNDDGFIIEPGTYQVTAMMSRYDGRDDVDMGDYNLKPGILYAFDLGRDHEKLIGGLYPLEGPLTILIDYFLIPHLFLSLSNAFSSISYYRKIFICSPEKLRSSIFSVIVAFNLIATGVFTLWFRKDDHMTFSALFFEIFLFAAIGALYTCVHAKVIYS